MAGELTEHVGDAAAAEHASAERAPPAEHASAERAPPVEHPSAGRGAAARAHMGEEVAAYEALRPFLWCRCAAAECSRS
jgi:hypothetical protein